MEQVKKNHSRGRHWKYRVEFKLTWPQVHYIMKLRLEPPVYTRKDTKRFLDEWYMSIKSNRKFNKNIS